MSPDSWLRLLKQHRAIAVIRATDIKQGQKMAHVAARAGIRLIEITWNSVRAADLIAILRQDLPTCTIGTGTVLDHTMLTDAIAAGAQFIFSPHVNPTLIEAAVSRGVPMIPGALTPTEIVTAWQAGASSVKVFPVGVVGGADYIRSLQGPLHQIPLIPTGGVTVSNAKAFLDAGAIAIGLSSHLFPPSLIKADDWSAVAQHITSLVVAVTDGDRLGWHQTHPQSDIS